MPLSFISVPFSAGRPLAGKSEADSASRGDVEVAVADGLVAMGDPSPPNQGPGRFLGHGCTQEDLWRCVSAVDGRRELAYTEIGIWMLA